MNLIQLEQSELAEFKKKKYQEQNGICPLLGIKVPLEQMACDHKHRTKAETIGENGCGLIRGLIHLQANSLEGKISNGFKRYGLHKFGISLPDFLRNLADYLENAKTNLIHPSEKAKKQKITKTCYNKLAKVARGKEKLPSYPKSGKLTVKLEKLFLKYNVNVEYYSVK